MVSLVLSKFIGISAALLLLNLVAVLSYGKSRRLSLSKRSVH